MCEVLKASADNYEDVMQMEIKSQSGRIEANLIVQILAKQALGALRTLKVGKAGGIRDGMKREILKEMENGTKENIK